MTWVFISGERRCARILIDEVFGLLAEGMTEKIQNGVKTPQAESAVERLFTAGVTGANVESDVVLYPWIDQFV